MWFFRDAFQNFSDKALWVDLSVGIESVYGICCSCSVRWELWNFSSESSLTAGRMAAAEAHLQARYANGFRFVCVHSWSSKSQLSENGLLHRRHFQRQLWLRLYLHGEPLMTQAFSVTSSRRLWFYHSSHPTSPNHQDMAVFGALIAMAANAAANSAERQN